jgi:signal transduction histidine kinase
MFDNGISYRIPEISPAWRQAEANGRIVFNRLPPGRYTLELKKNSGTVEAAKRLQFEVLPRFYETAWFRIVATGVVLALLLALYRWRLAILSAQKKKLEKKVQQRTSELHSNMQQLEKTIKELEFSEQRIFRNGMFKEKLTSMILHDLRSPLRFLSGVATHIRQHYASMPEGELDRQLNELATACSNVYYFSNDFMEWIKARQNDFNITITPVNIQEVFDEIAQLYFVLARYKRNSIEVMHTTEVCLTDMNMLRIIIRNLVDNANKYTQGGAITLAAVKQPGTLQIVVTDTGKGIPASVLSSLENEYDFENAQNNQTLGLKLVFDLTRNINGHIHFSSEPKKGTTVTISLPQ